jgi:hypothetical protein
MHHIVKEGVSVDKGQINRVFHGKKAGDEVRHNAITGDQGPGARRNLDGTEGERISI